MTKKYQICHHQIRFFSSSKCTKIRPGPRWGSLQRSPRPPSRLWRGIPSPLNAFGRRLELGASVLLTPHSTQNPGYASDHNT